MWGVSWEDDDDDTEIEDKWAIEWLIYIRLEYCKNRLYIPVGVCSELSKGRECAIKDRTV